ncbi:MAG: amidohydrolase family protein [Alphaproteobacteria bacterium]
MTKSKSQIVREGLNHPIIDADAHMLEVEPVLMDYVKDVGGSTMVKRYVDMLADGKFWGWYHATPEERARKRIKRAPFWMFPAGNTRDRATAMFPGLLRSRLDEFGIDFSFVYPTLAILFVGLDDEEMRRGVVRAINTMNADLFDEYSDRLAPAAVIPMHTPVEAIEELDFAVGQRGLKAAMVEGAVRRPIQGAIGGDRDLASAAASYWIDPLALDSPYDYDPVWQKCMDLKVAPTMHTSTMGWVDRTSISNVTFNHIGHFAAGSQAFCKALVLGGVTRRFPDLKFGFLECGVGWAASLYNDLIEHWEKRNVPELKRHLDPARIDREMLVELATQYGGPKVQTKLDALKTSDGFFYEWPPERETDLDDFARCGIVSEKDIYDLFVPNFYFGCESDDRIMAWAFNQKLNQFGAKFKALIGSDIGHFDVTDARKVIAKAYSLVEEGSLTLADFRDLTFVHPAEMHAGMNPDIFKGTVVEDAVAAAMKTKAEA